VLAKRQSSIPGAQAFVFDLGYSGYVLAQAAGASHFAIRAGAGGVINGRRPGKGRRPRLGGRQVPDARVQVDRRPADLRASSHKRPASNILRT